jgi:DNA-binding response OmpR family regulator
MILIAEDNWLPALELEHQLAADGRRVVVAATAEAALAAAAAEPPKLAIVDLQLKDGMDGAALARALVGRGVPVLIYTGYAEAAARQALGDTPVLGVLEKPASAETLLATIRAGLRRSAAA